MTDKKDTKAAEIAGNYEPTVEVLDQMRETGYRPTAVACLLHDKKILLLFKLEYKIWSLPQCGINTEELASQALWRELHEEMGVDFYNNLDGSIVYIGDDQVEFLPEKQTGEELKTNNGKSFKMVGKHYYFFAVGVKTEEVKIEQTEYNEYYWLNAKAAKIMASKMYQPGKKRITQKAIDLLTAKGLLE